MNRTAHILLGCTFLFSAMIKAVNVFGFGETVSSFCALLGWDALYSHGVLIGTLVCSMETVLGIWMLDKKRGEMASLPVAVLLAFFTYITGYNLWSPYGGLASCGCFGELIHLTPTQTFYKNIVLFVLSLYLVPNGIKAFCRPFPSLNVKGVHVGLMAFFSLSLPACSYFSMHSLPRGVYIPLYIVLCVVVLGFAWLPDLEAAFFSRIGHQKKRTP